MNHNTLAKKRAALLTKRANTNVVIPRGKYSFESNLVMKCGELEQITERAAVLLGDAARLMGHGEEYQKICQVLNDLNSYYEKSIEFVSTGNDWGVVSSSQRETKVSVPKFEGKIFGLEQDKISAMQGGGELR